MNVQMMEGLVGASASLKLSGTPMSVYRQASAEGDETKMKRALGYTGECTEKAEKYQEKLDKGIKAEAKAEREKAKLEREAAIEKRREERKKAEEGADRPPETDTVRLSPAAQAALEARAAEAVEAEADREPVLYTEAGETAPAPAEAEPVISCLA